MATVTPAGRLVDIGGRRLHAVACGQGEPVVVIEPALASCSVEWVEVQEQLAQTTRVFAYDRAGHGFSDPGPFPRTPRQVATELRALLRASRVHGPFVLLAHSQGGLFARQFAALFPGEVAGAVFVDPLSPDDARFRRDLPRRVFRGSGADKTLGLKVAWALGRSRLLPALKSLLTRVPPMSSYRALPEGAFEAMWHHLSRRDMHDASLNEYRQALLEENVAPLRGKTLRIPGPVTVIHHGRERMIEEVMRYGRLPREDASAVEHLFEELSREYLSLSDQGRWVVAERSGHAVHLSEPHLIVDEVLAVVAQARATVAARATRAS